MGDESDEADRLASCRDLGEPNAQGFETVCQP